MTPYQLPQPSQSAQELTVEVAGATHRGHVREINEDHYLILRFGRSLETIATNLDNSLFTRQTAVTGYGMLVADGMGGMAGGEVASSVALQKLVDLVIDTPDWILSFKQWEDVARVLKRLSDRFVEIDKAIRDRARADMSLQGMGTTLTVAATLGSDLILGHIGDSRVYLLRDDQLTQLTTDHTLAQALIQAGVMDPDDQATRSIRHVLTAAVGSLDSSTSPQVQRIHLNAGDVLLLCTDGLSDLVEEETIKTVLGEQKSAHRACHDLVDLALAGGGRDNITVVVARFGLEGNNPPNNAA